jgi:hypothetical protein
MTEAPAAPDISTEVVNGNLGGVFDHVGIAVADLAASERF